VYFYAAPYTAADRTGASGGLAEDAEDSEALELDFDEARAMIADGASPTPCARAASSTAIPPAGVAASVTALKAGCN
jgi:hypothetical protein